MRLERVAAAAALGALILLWQRWDARPIEHPPGVLVPEAPLQSEGAQDVLRHGDYTLTRRAVFNLRARVLSRENYRFDAGADLAPVDLALGWGPMSDQAVLDRIDVRQSGRWYFLRWDGTPPLPETELMRHSGNMHLVPAEGWIEDLLADVREGQVLRLGGYLVDAVGEGGYTWTTSLSRDDTGDGSCELFYVEQVVLE